MATDRGSPATNAELLIGSVSPSEADTGPASARSGRLELVWLGPGLPAVGGQFALFSEKGDYAGFVRVTAQPEPPDNLKRLVVEVIDGSVPDPPNVTTVAVGSLDAPPRRGHVVDSQGIAWWSTSEWLVHRRVDLEGDGKWDAEAVIRCGHFSESKCGRACDEQCVGTRRSGQRAPDPAAVECSSFIPDTIDRFPDVAGKC
jgi:hypothetical protein